MQRQIDKWGSHSFDAESNSNHHCNVMHYGAPRHGRAMIGAAMIGACHVIISTEAKLGDENMAFSPFYVNNISPIHFRGPYTHATTVHAQILIPTVMMICARDCAQCLS